MIPEGEIEIFVFIGECDEALKEPAEIEDGVDEHTPVDIDPTLEVLEIHRHPSATVLAVMSFAIRPAPGGPDPLAQPILRIRLLETFV
jgi:hypothetical protein